MHVTFFVVKYSKQRQMCKYVLIAFCSLAVIVGSLVDVEFMAVKYEIPEP